MKFGLLFLSFLFTAPAFATPNPDTLKAVIEAQGPCDSFIRYDDANAYLASGRYYSNFDTDKPRPQLPGILRVAPLDGSPAFVLQTPDAPVDMVTDGNQAYVLTYSELELWDLSKRSMLMSFPTTSHAQPLEYKQHAQAMVRYGNKLVIAHGRLGVSIFDLTSKTITHEIPFLQSQLPQESMAMGLSVQGSSIYVLMDSFTLNGPYDNPAFRGFIILDMNSEQVSKQLNGLDPGGASLASAGSKMVVSFYGSPIWLFDANNMKRFPHPQADIFRFLTPGHPTGSAVMDDKYYYTCFMKAPTQLGGQASYVPLALDRRVYLLGAPTPAPAKANRKL